MYYKAFGCRAPNPLGRLTALPRPSIAGFRGRYRREEGKEGKETERKGRNGKAGLDEKGMGHPTIAATANRGFVVAVKYITILAVDASLALVLQHHALCRLHVSQCQPVPLISHFNLYGRDSFHAITESLQNNFCHRHGDAIISSLVTDDKAQLPAIDAVHIGRESKAATLLYCILSFEHIVVSVHPRQTRHAPQSVAIQSGNGLRRYGTQYIIAWISFCRLHYSRRLCLSAWVGCSARRVCLSVCKEHNSKTNDPKCSTWYMEWPWPWDILEMTYSGISRSQVRFSVQQHGVGSNSSSLCSRRRTLLSVVVGRRSIFFDEIQSNLENSTQCNPTQAMDGPNPWLTLSWLPTINSFNMLKSVTLTAR